MTDLTPPPPAFVPTREALWALACYAISPARKARTGRIGLRPSGEGFATPPFDDGTRIAVRGDRLRIEPGTEVAITTLRAAADVLDVELSPDPGVGHDLPPYAPDAILAVDAAASRWLGTWYAFGSRHLDRLTAARAPGLVSEAQLWPEHFDLAVVVDVGGGANIGFSPGDGAVPEPYVYVGPHDTSRLEGEFWNAPFGAVLHHTELRGADDPDQVTTVFLDEGLRRVEEAAPRR
jgi:hypothetical protein